MRIRDLIKDDIQHKEGIDLEFLDDADVDDTDLVQVRALSHGRELGRVIFHRSGDTLQAVQVEVQPQYRGQGIARIMYDHARGQGYRIMRSAEQTDAGRRFWNKHRGEERVWERTLKEAKACGDCFEVAGRAMISPEVPEMQLVHAYVTGQGPIKGRRFSHAWNEIGDVVLDYSNGRRIMMRKPQYYELGQVSTNPGEYAVYDDEAAKKKMVQTRHWGPWDLDPDKERIDEINSPGELGVDENLIDRFTRAGWYIDGEGQDQLVLSKPGSQSVLKIVGQGSLPRQATIRRYVTFFRANRRNPHFPKVGPDREFKWNGKRYYVYSQERLRSLPGDERVMDYLERFMGNYDKDPAIDERDIPDGLTYEQVDGLAQAMDSMFRAGFATTGYDLGNVANIMQRDNGQMVIVDPFSSWNDDLAESKVEEVKILSKVKGKGSEPGQLPRFGRPIEPGREEYYLGRRAGSFQGYDIYRDWLGGQLSYHLFDPRNRVAVLTTFGSQYKGNPDSYIIHGLYAAPGNTVKAHQFYRALIQDLGLTLISDRKQSPGGNRVWQRLEAYPDVTVYGFDTKTGEILNFGAQDAEMYSIPSRAIRNAETQHIANHIRLVATAKKS